MESRAERGQVELGRAVLSGAGRGRVGLGRAAWGGAGLSRVEWGGVGLGGAGEGWACIGVQKIPLLHDSNTA